ncbi:Crp/Fnr family transcriptional regulator [soil metagenome]
MSQDSLFSQLDSFFKNHKLLTYKKRNIIPSTNDGPLSVFYIKSGYIRVYRISEQGEELTLNILKPRDIFPLTYGISHKPNSYYLEALTSLEIWRAPQEVFVEYIKSDTQLYQELTNRIIVRFDGLLTRMEYLVFSNAYTKVVSTLLVCAKRFGEERGNEVVIKVPLTHKDIATLIGITRETTSLEMKRLEKQGYLGKSGRNIVLKNITQLESEILTPIDGDSPISYSL